MYGELKIAVIGGGSSYTPELMEGFIKRYDELPIKELYLVDVEAGKDKLDIIAGLLKRMAKKAGLNIEIHKTYDRRIAIKEADFVITQFRAGGLKCRALDEEIPLKYNLIGQETTGAGGFAKALRTIPIILDICRDIEELSPDAWLINFTNPSGIITEVINRYSRVKAVGLCNVPIGMLNNVSKILNVKNSRIKIDFMGLNHMIYGKKIFLDGEDVTQEVLEKLCNEASFTMKNILDLVWDKELIKVLGVLPCPYHRYFYLREEMLKEQKESYYTHKTTRATKVMEIEKELFKIYEDERLNEKPKELEQRGGAYYSDAAVSLISAIYNDKKEIHTVNIKNQGAISNLSEDVVVEVNAVIDRSGARPICVGELPAGIHGLVQAIKDYELLTVEAAVNGDYEKALMALIANPLVSSYDLAKDVLKDILAENKEYLTQFYRH